MAFVVRSSGTYVPCTVKNVVQELNGQETASLEFQNDISTRAFVAQDRPIEIYWGGILIYTGTLQKVAYNEDEPRLSCTVFDSVYDKLDKKPFLSDGAYDGLDDNSDIKHILADAVAVVPGVTSDSDRIGVSYRIAVRYNNTSVYAVVQDLARNGNADYWSIGGTQVYIGDKGIDRGNIPVQSVSRSEVDRHVKRTAVIVRGHDANGYEVIGTAGDVVNGDIVSYTEYGENNQNGLNTIAATKLDNLNKDSSGVSLKVSMAYAYPYMTGDTVTLINEKLALNGTYRIWKITKTENMANIEIDTPEMLLEKYLSNQRQLEDLGIVTGKALLDDPIGPPAAPTGFAKVQSNGQIHFSWKANDEADLQRYNLYSSDTNDFESKTLLAKTDALSYIWNIPQFTTGTKYYWLTALDRVGNESDPDGVISTTVFTLSIPSTPTGFKAIEGTSDISLTWNANSVSSDQSPIKNYLVYKGTYNDINNADTELVETTSATSFIDANPVIGISYYYWLKAIDLVGNESDPSGIGPIIIKGVVPKGSQSWTSNIVFSVNTTPNGGNPYYAVDCNGPTTPSNGTITFADEDILTIDLTPTNVITVPIGISYIYWFWPLNILQYTSNYNGAIGATKGILAIITADGTHPVNIQNFTESSGETTSIEQSTSHLLWVYGATFHCKDTHTGLVTSGTDASTILQGGITATTGICHVKSGNYPILTTLTPHSDLKIICEPGTNFICADVGLFLSTTYTVNFTLEGCNITNPTGLTGTTAKALVFDMLQHSEIKNVDIADNWDIGIEITNSLYGSCYNKLENIRVHRGTYGGSYGIKLTPNEINPYVVAEFDSTWNRVVVENYTVGVRHYGDRMLYLNCITGNTICHGTGWQVDGPGLAGSTTTNNCWINSLNELQSVGFVIAGTYYNTFINTCSPGTTTPFNNTCDWGITILDAVNMTLPFTRFSSYIQHAVTVHPDTVALGWDWHQYGYEWWCITHLRKEFWDGAKVITEAALMSPNYLCFHEGAHFKAIDGRTGSIVIDEVTDKLGLQYTLNLIGANGGEVDLVPDDYYLYGINVPNNTKLKGLAPADGENLSTGVHLICNSNNQIVINTGSNIELENLVIDGLRGTYDITNGIQTGAGTHIKIKNCVIQNCSVYGIIMSGADFVEISGCTMKSNTFNLATGILGYTNVTIIDNLMADCEYAIQILVASSHVTIERNRILRCTGNSLQTDSVSIHDLKILNNTITGATIGYGIVLGGVITDSVIEGNYLSGNYLGNAIGALCDHVKNNPGYKTSAGGVATILSGTTVVNIAHGLDYPPMAHHVHVTPIESLNDAASFWFVHPDDWHINIYTNIDPGANVDFMWEIDKID